MSERDGDPTAPEPERAAAARWHASCVARHGAAVLLLGGSGSGKSDLALRLLDRGFDLVADDRVLLRNGLASAPDALRGLIEVRGLGLLRVPPVTHPVRVALAVVLDGSGARLPEPEPHPVLRVPLLRLAAFDGSTALRIELALDCLAGRRSLAEGALF